MLISSSRSSKTWAENRFAFAILPAVVPAIADLLVQKSAVASNSPFLRKCGITGLPQVHAGFTDRDELKAACAAADIGITSADYALAATGTFVMLSSHNEARLISLLPPAHIAIFPRSRILANLDELLSILPRPADQTSSMVLITGPSRTADIEQILVRGVHGPGEIYAVIVDEEIDSLRARRECGSIHRRWRRIRSATAIRPRPDKS